jgi:hypothetical protein
MANEATLIYETGLPIPFTCANATGIEKGTLLTMSDPMTAAACAGDEDIIAGIAATEKIANDGKTKISVYRSGIFKVYASGSITVGDALISASSVTAYRNYVKSAGVNGEDIVGISLETATDGQTFLMELKPFTMNLA